MPAGKAPAIIACTDDFWIPTATGKCLDLLNPDPKDICIEDIATALAQITRWSGQIPGGPYSIAQHSVNGAGLLFERHGKAAALEFILHDAHEAYMNDLTPMLINTVAHLAERLSPETGNALRKAIKQIKSKLDAAIHKALNLPYTYSPDLKLIIHDMDLAMAKAEARKIITATPRPWSKRLDSCENLDLGLIDTSQWDWKAAKDTYLERFEKYAA